MTQQYDGTQSCCGLRQELEGLDIIDSDVSGVAPDIGGHGQLHVVMIDNSDEAFNDDGWYWKHYRADVPGHL
jgi:hypothetical protein